MARELVGCVLEVAAAGEKVAGRIVEVEAYLGEGDPASHAGRGRTPRSEIMFGPPGFAYVYLIYGMHHCLNVVTVGEGVPEAVLIRGGVPVMGNGLVRRRRGPKVALRNLADGPGKLCHALAVTRAENGLDFGDPGSPLTIRSDGRGFSDLNTDRLPRIGVDYAGDAASWPLRFKLR